MPKFGVMQYHEGDVTWTQKIDVPKNAPPGEYPIAGLIGYQVCERSGGTCEMPQRRAFRHHAEGRTRAQQDRCDPLTFAPGESYPKVAAAAAALADFYGRQSAGDQTATRTLRVRRPIT